MRFIVKHSIWLLFLSLLTANIVVFIYGVKLSDEINHYEKEIKNLRVENTELEKKVYDISSLTYAASIAAQLRFNTKAQPVYLDTLKYAHR